MINVYNFIKKIKYNFKKFFLNKYYIAEKSESEYGYWKKRFNIESRLKNNHFEYFFTKFFDIDKTFYNNKKILDIGCGPRGSLEWADNAGERIGLDPLVWRYKNIGIKNHKMRYTESMAERMPFNDNYFDVVCSFNSLDHVDDIKKVVKEIVRVTKKNGIFLLITEFGRSEPKIGHPQSFSYGILDKFKLDFRLLYKDIRKKNGKGIYSSVIYGDIFNLKDKYAQGVLVAKLIKK